MPEWLAAPIEAMNSGSGAPWAIVASASLAFVAVFVAGHLARRTQRLVLSFQNQAELLWDKDYIVARRVFIEIRDGDQAKIIAVAQATAQKDEDASAVRTIMNDYELVASGIHRNILDDPFLRTFNRGTAIKDFDMMKPYIDEMRRVNGNDAIFAEFEKMVVRWRSAAPNSSRIKPWWSPFGR